MKATRISWGNPVSFGTPFEQENISQTNLFAPKKEEIDLMTDLGTGTPTTAPKEDLFEGFGDLSGMTGRATSTGTSNTLNNKDLLDF